MWLDRFVEQLAIPLFRLGKNEVTVWTVLSFTLLLFFLVYVTRRIGRWISERLLGRTKIDPAARYAIGKVSQYVVLILGFIIILQSVGIDLTTLNILAGAVGIGVGFGLQNIANNLISGLIILFERPIKIGDRIQVNDVHGAVTKIGTRSTTVLTNDNIAIIVPNSKIISENVVNWSHNDENVRIRIPVSVAYGSDVRKVEQLLLAVAHGNRDVLPDPAPTVRFLAFGDSGLHFEILAWTMTLTHRKGKLISDLNFAIYESLKRNNIEIPFPQRDLHIRSGELPIRQMQ